MSESQDLRMFYVLKRCAGQFARPLGVTADEVNEAEKLGLLRFKEWPSGHFHITDRGRDFLFALSQQQEGKDR